MKKIPTIFIRNPDNMKEILPKPHPDCDWVFRNEGVATRKYNGTCVLIDDGNYYKRREIRKEKIPPPDFIEIEHDQNTGKRVGWVPVKPDDKADRWHIEAFKEDLDDGTYELCGPKIQGNPEEHGIHVLIQHSKAEQYENVPRTYEGLKQWFSDKPIEGIVFHHPDGRMAKIKKRDYGLSRKQSNNQMQPTAKGGG